jgi:phospholipid/cholesterol/gamma-HCH transport system ATP-binding protein
MKNSACIELQGVHKSFAGQKVLDGLNLQIPRGKITVILGRSGVGKSVMLKHMIGLIKPDRGRVMVDGVNMLSLDKHEINEFREKFGMLFQGAALFDSLSVFDNVAFPMVEHTSFDKEKIAKIVKEKLALVGLRGIEGKMPAELSGGMKKRVGLARAIALDPEIILYDEPTTGLDPVMTASVNQLILDTQKKLNITSVVISHDIGSAFQIADKIAMIEEGKIVAEGDPATFKMSTQPLVRKFLS